LANAKLTGALGRGQREGLMQRLGNQDDGFEVELNKETHAIRVKAWGFWNAELASKFFPAVVQACQSRVGPLSLFMDARGLKPQREPGQEALGTLLAALPGLGVTGGNVVTDSSLTRLQLLRLAKERTPKSLVQFTLVEQHL
jgi:hypothetical protein